MLKTGKHFMLGLSRAMNIILILLLLVLFAYEGWQTLEKFWEKNHYLQVWTFNPNYCWKGLNLVLSLKITLINKKG